MNKKIYNILKKNDIKIDEDLFYYGWANFTRECKINCVSQGRAT